MSYRMIANILDGCKAKLGEELPASEREAQETKYARALTLCEARHPAFSKSYATWFDKYNEKRMEMENKAAPMAAARVDTETLAQVGRCGNCYKSGLMVLRKSKENLLKPDISYATREINERRFSWALSIHKQHNPSQAEDFSKWFDGYKNEQARHQSELKRLHEELTTVNGHMTG